MKNIKETKLTSLEPRTVNNRFLVKASTLESPGNKPSIMLSVYDLHEKYIKLYYYSNEDDAKQKINLLKLAN